MSKNWYTADPHFGHKGIMKHCDRPFDSVSQMDAAIIDNYNQKVKPNDRLFILGDFCWGNNPTEYSQRINCKNITLVHGNHDPAGVTKSEVWERSVQYLEVKDSGHHLVLFHYPILEWNGWFRGSWHLYGHVHGTHAKKEEGSRRLDIGVDVHNFQPLDIKDIREIMKGRGHYD